MAQDITPGSSNQSTNTMNPRNLSAASAGSVTPTIISQSNADRRRRMAAEREARRRESLTANVERAEVEREYRRLREAEERANAAAEARKAKAKKESVVWYAGGVNTPLEVTRTNMADYLGGNLRGAQEAAKTPEGLSQYQTIGGGNVEDAYRGLEELSKHVLGLEERGRAEERMMQNVRAAQAAQIGGGSVNVSPMSEEARAAHERLIKDESTSPEMRAQLKADLDVNLRNMQEYQARGGVLSAEDERYLSEDVYRGGSNYTREQKDIAGRMLAAAGSRYDVADFNRSASSIQATQLSRSQSALEARYRNVEGRSNDIDSRTKEALRVNQQGAAGMLSTLFEESRAAQLTGDRSRYGYRDAQGNFVEVSTDRNKTGTAAAGEAAFARQDAAAKERLAVIEQGDDYVNSILKVSGGLDLSSSAFFGEQVKTEKRFGSEWASAGGETAEDAMRAGKDATGYSRFKGLPDNAGNEYILVGSAGKQRYTLRTGLKDGGFAVYGWSGDLVSSGTSLSGLADALKDLDVPFDEKRFNAAAPEKGAVAVRLAEMTDISGIDTAATYRAELLGTLRSNESVQSVESERRAAEKAADVSAALAEMDKRMTDELGYTLRVNASGELPNINTIRPGMYVSPGAEGKGQIRSSDITMVRDPAVDDALKSAGDLMQRVSPPAAIAGALMRTDSKRIDGAEEKRQQDFIVTQNEGALAELSDALISGSEMIGEANAGFNDWFKDLTGHKLIETEYGNPERSWADLAGELAGATPLKLGFKIAGNSLGISDAEPDFMTEIRRSVNKQILEMPLYAGSLIKIGDSIASSGAEGGVPAAAAAAGFWGARAVEGVTSEAITNPRKLVVDLTAGLAVGTATSAAVKPFVFIGKTVGLKTGEITGFVNTGLDPVGKPGYKQGRLSVVSRPSASKYVLGKGQIEQLIHYQRHPFKGELFFNANEFPYYTINKIDSKPRAFQWASINPFEDLRPAGERATIRGSQYVFTYPRRSNSFRNKKAAFVYQNVEKIGNYIPEELRLKLLEKFDKDADFTQAEITYLYDLGQDVATRTGSFVAVPSPKSLKQFRGEPENEVVIFAPDPKNKIGEAIEKGKKGAYFIAPNSRFGGFDRLGTPIYYIDTAKSAKPGKHFNPLFMVKNAKDTVKDLRFNPKHGFYYQSRARFDAALGRENFYDNLNSKSKGFFRDIMYGSHNWSHYENVRKNMKNMVLGSKNPEVQAVKDDWMFFAAHMHDINKINRDVIREHGKRAGMLIDIGMYDDIFKAFGKNDPKFKSSVASAISKHTSVKRNTLKYRLKYRPNVKDMLLINADRMDLTRYNAKPDPKRMFIHEVMDEPRWIRGELFPPAPEKGSYEMFEKAVKSNKPKNTGDNAYSYDKTNYDDVYESDYPTTDRRSLLGAGVLGGSSFIPKDKKQTSSKKRKDYDKYDDYSEYKGDSYYNYKIKEYPRIRDYKTGGYSNKIYSDYRISKEGRYNVLDNYKSKYVIKDKGYNIKGYSKPYPTKSANYVMGSKYSVNPYQRAGAYKALYNAPVKPDITPKQVRLRNKKDKKEKVSWQDFKKITFENVEIPIVRGEEALFSKNVGVFELPANKKTLYEFGGIFSTKKPSIKKKKRR